MFSTNFLSEFVYCILNCYAHMNILQMEYAHYKCKLLLLLLISDSEDFGVPSDHKAITFDVNLSIRTLNKNQQEMFSFKKADFEGLGTALRNDPPENYLDNDSNINDINLVLLYLNV